MESDYLKNRKAELDLLEKKIDYKYNDNGELINKKTKKKCNYTLSKLEYQQIGNYITKYIQLYILQIYNLIPMYVPSNLKNPNFYKRIKSKPQCEIFVSKDFNSNPKCIILIQGSGNVKVGLWSRSVCINDNLYNGSNIPYIERANIINYSIIILNPNERFDIDDNKKKINEFDNMNSHCLYVYENIIKKNKNIKEIYFIGHSKGGECILNILINNENDLINGKIKKIAFLDSVHGEIYKFLSDIGKNYLRYISKGFIKSEKPLGSFIYNADFSNNGVNCYSAGHILHEYTSPCAIEEVFKWLNESENIEK